MVIIPKFWFIVWSIKRLPGYQISSGSRKIKIMQESNDIDTTVRHERILFYIRIRCCTRDEGRPLGAILQEQASNHLKPLWPKAVEVSIQSFSLPLVVYPGTINKQPRL